MPPRTISRIGLPYLHSKSVFVFSLLFMVPSVSQLYSAPINILYRIILYRKVYQWENRTIYGTGGAL